MEKMLEQLYKGELYPYSRSHGSASPLILNPFLFFLWLIPCQSL